MAKKILIFFGAPGSGKGTQSDLLANKTKLTKITTGDLLRSEVAAGSVLGKKAKGYMQKGVLVPDSLIKDMILKRLESASKSGYIFDGYPRNLKQLEDLEEIFAKIVKKNDLVYGIEVAVSDSEVKRRLGGRRACVCGAVYHLKYNPPKKTGKCDVCGKKLFIRKDDKPKVISNRLKVYHNESEPVLDYFRKGGNLIKINGEQSIAKIHRDIMGKLKKLAIVK